MSEIMQGEILSVEKLPFPVLIVSKDFFNQMRQVIACPVYPDAAPDPLHISIEMNHAKSFVLCEQLKLLDLRQRGYKKLAELDMETKMNIVDAIQGIFDYV